MLRLALLIALTACSAFAADQDPVKQRDLIQRKFQSAIGPSVATFDLWSASAFTLIIQGSFEGDASQVDAFIKCSKLLAKRSPIAKSLPPCDQLPWWTCDAASLDDAFHSEWIDGRDVADCRFFVTKNKDGKRRVFFELVYEDLGSTSSRPDVAADPQWQPPK